MARDTIMDNTAMGVRRFGRVNWLGLATLAKREVMRFMAVWQQTIFAPLMTAGLFVLVFALALGQGRGEVMGLPYLVFLGPGILMMTVIQNAFANTSSSMSLSKATWYTRAQPWQQNCFSSPAKGSMMGGPSMFRPHSAQGSVWFTTRRCPPIVGEK